MIGKVLGLLTGVGVVCLAGCGGTEYRAGQNMRIVYPNRGWRKPGVSAKEIFEKRQECAERIKNDKQYREWVFKQRDLHPENNRISPYMTVECMQSQGFTWGKVTPEDVYIPPPPPRWGWVKEGVSQGDAGNQSVRCSLEVIAKPGDSNEKLTKCMEDKGFKWEIVDPHPASPFSD